MLSGTWRATWKSHLVYHLEKSLGVRTVAGHGRIQVARQVAFDFHLASLQGEDQVQEISSWCTPSEHIFCLFFENLL